MMRPFSTTTDQDMRSRAAALRAASYKCATCRRPKINLLSIEVYSTQSGAVVLCIGCARIAKLLALFGQWCRRVGRSA